VCPVSIHYFSRRRIYVEKKSGEALPSKETTRALPQPKKTATKTRGLTTTKKPSLANSDDYSYEYYDNAIIKLDELMKEKVVELTKEKVEVPELIKEKVVELTNEKLTTDTVMNTNFEAPSTKTSDTVKEDNDQLVLNLIHDLSHLANFTADAIDK
jgi:hypothetical protein